MKYQLGISAILADATAVSSLENSQLFGGSMVKAYWQSNGGEKELGLLAGFIGRTSYHGSSASIQLPFPSESNPRLAGQWNKLLTPSDSKRVRVTIMPAGSNVELPLFMGVPSPDGLQERYLASSEQLEITLEDVTGVASRMNSFTTPLSGGATIDAFYAANIILSPLKVYCFYPLLPVDGCLEIFPSALQAADNLLIKMQDELNPLTGYKRVRYGDRNGNIIYRLIEVPEVGQQFTPPFPAEPYDFSFSDREMLSGLKVDVSEMAFATSRVNPYADLGGRAFINLPRADLSETVEFTEIGWRLLPKEEKMSLKARRERTI